jgi:mannose-6-phosphate isomerase-like protein (cupin superfamily)
MILRHLPPTVPTLAIVLFAGSTLLAASAGQIAMTNLDVILKNEPLLPDGSTASMVASIRAGGAELGVLVLSKNRLHHHVAQDHVLYVARGNGIARLENATGRIETRAIQAGDILSLPRGRKHGFEKSGGEDLVFLVIATPLPRGVEETTYHE